MLTTTHLLSGIAIGTFFVSIDGNTHIESSIMFLSAGISILPDINMIWHNRVSTHHQSFTHYPFLVILFTIIISLVEFLVFKDIFYSMLISLNLILHLILDLFGLTIGIHLLWPFSNKEFSITKLHKELTNSNFKEKFRFIIRNNLLIYDLLVIIISFLIILRFY